LLIFDLLIVDFINQQSAISNQQSNCAAWGPAFAPDGASARLWPANTAGLVAPQP
jgi:hypothetical protein